jgi:hypothetical protein
MADLSPNSALLHALANQALPWWKALAELVDNAFDAGAKRVEIIAKNKTVVVKDDGKGIKNILAIATLGHHDRQESTQLGMYGIGAKDAWLFCSEVLDVDTVHSGQRCKLRVDVKELVKNNWQCDDPTYEPTDSPSGTTIRLPLRPGRNLPGQDALDELAFVFTPAISNGLQIVSDTKAKSLPKPLRPHTMPMLEDSVRSTFDIDGKAVQIDIGILPDGVKMDRGPLWLQYKHRILGRSSIGIGQYSSLRIAGRIILGEGWKLSKNKDDLTLNKDRLNDAIFVRIEGILKKASMLSETIESAALRSLLECQLNEFIDESGKNKKPARSKGDTVGSVGPKATPRKVTKASKTRGLPGTAECQYGESGRKHGFVFDWENSSPDSIGRFDRGGSRVFLNLDHPFVAASKAAQNNQALLCCASALIADDAARHDSTGNALLAFKFKDFSTALGGLMSSFKEVKQNEKVAV